jgi:hypothetical protein
MNADAPPIAADDSLMFHDCGMVAVNRVAYPSSLSSIIHRRQSAGHRRSSAFPKTFAKHEHDA